jgi:hypothetical protein
MTDVMTAEPKTCRTCQKELWRRNKSGLCRVCQQTDPEAIARRNEGWRRAYTVRPELLKACGERLRAVTRTPGHAERARKMMVEQRLWERGIEALGAAGSDVRLKAGKSLSRSRLSHIPPQYHDEYRRLVNNKGFRAAEALKIIIDEHETKMQRWRDTILPECIPEIAHIPLPLSHDLIDAVAEIYCVERGDILGRSRLRNLVDARALIVKVLRDDGFSYPAIGKTLGRDHTSVLHLYHSFDDRASANPFIRQALACIREARGAALEQAA